MVDQMALVDVVGCVLVLTPLLLWLVAALSEVAALDGDVVPRRRRCLLDDRQEA